MRKCPRCGLVSPDRSVRCECGFLLEVMTAQLQQAIELLQISRRELADTVRDEILKNPILEDAVDSASEDPKTLEAANALSRERARRRESAGAQTVRNSIREHLALLADLEAQRRYDRDVPIADVPAELLCIWFDDIYHPESPAHQGAFTSPELEALSNFSLLFDRVRSGLGEIHTVAELQAREEWIQLSAAAEELLHEIPGAPPKSATMKD